MSGSRESTSASRTSLCSPSWRGSWRPRSTAWWWSTRTTKLLVWSLSQTFSTISSFVPEVTTSFWLAIASQVVSYTVRFWLWDKTLSRSTYNLHIAIVLHLVHTYVFSIVRRDKQSAGCHISTYQPQHLSIWLWLADGCGPVPVSSLTPADTLW